MKAGIQIYNDRIVTGEVMSDKSVNIKINNKDFQVTDNITILEACKNSGINIPTLCYIEGISEEAACSICVVEVKGAKTLVRSCVTGVREGMEIFTDTERVEKARMLNTELILANHPLDCMTCDRDGDCLLQDMAYRYGIKRSRFLSENKIFDRLKENSWSTNPFIQFDESKSQNPFAYYTAAITNSFTRVLNLEKRNQNIRDDLLQEAGQLPSFSRQLDHEAANKAAIEADAREKANAELKDRGYNIFDE